MGRFSKLFFNSDNDENTLHDRTSLTDEQLSEAKQKKDALLGYLKSDLSATLDVDVRHWLQGSYKSHTLIRPVKKKQEFDIDVGIYLMCNAEDEDLQAGQIKSLNRQVLSWYAAENALQLEPSKSKCERITFPQSFHLDIPIYYKDEDANICKLATDNGWIDSDPQAFQNWFQETVSDYEASELARLRRVIRYFKTWNCLCVNRGKFAGFSSIAITVLVATYYGIAAEMMMRSSIQ